MGQWSIYGFGVGAAVSMATLRLMAWQAMASGQAVGLTTARLPVHCATSVGAVAAINVTTSANTKSPATQMSSCERDVDTEC